MPVNRPALKCDRSGSDSQIHYMCYCLTSEQNCLYTSTLSSGLTPAASATICTSPVLRYPAISARLPRKVCTQSAGVIGLRREGLPIIQ